MRKLIFAINTTLDGCVDHTKGIGNEEIHEYFAHMLGEVDTLVYGRKTYELMVPFWPDMAKTHSGSTQSMNDFAHAFDAVENIVVFSRTLDKVEHPKTRIVSTGLKEEILKLKQEEGKDILLGGVDVPSQLLELGLIDEFRFVVQPLIVGEGRRLFDTVSPAEKLQLNLIKSKVFESGYVALHYAK
ncbi:dihydrofolate reductase family protein [Polluticoccus soli]|uniref:dihydrofolate reductase family protein n=1 Tax=Polluticoccus soli TaxID=3034150 RepID=UPI0023E2ABA1|nr:dihydrofolate reductase family protein [Flavipsychrobacter sp. JY13-12]